MFVKNRAIRLFVSSTFQDMHEERDALCRFVFPYLEDFCAKRNIGFMGVDLRWGVTEEEARQGKTIGLCLAEIDNCRPYFLGILGHRYGWIPPRELTTAHAALFRAGVSITAAEMLYGVLNTPSDQQTNAFFCLRSLSLSQKIAGDVEENGKDRRRLEDLKKKIRESGHPVLDDYTSIESFRAYIIEQLCRSIEADFPAHEAWDEYKSEAIAHTYYARMQHDVFSGRNREIGYIDHYVKTNSHIPLFITGASGTGKTALLAKWAIHHEELAPHDFVFMHFYGASIYSGQWESLVKRLIYELCQRCQIEFSLPDTSGELVASLSAYLHMASRKGVRMMLVLDGVDLINAEETYGLAWLPKELPTGVQLILSVKTESGRKSLLERGYKEYRIALLTTAEQESMISAHLKPYAKKLDAGHITRILQNKAASNPLYLKILLHELCIGATHDNMDWLLSYYLEAQNVAELFIKVIQAYEKAYNINGIAITRQVLSFICEAKHGLTENEILAVLQIPQASFSPLYLALKPYLLNKNGILNFAYSGLRDAVKAYYPLSIPEQKAIRMRLAENFRKNPATFHALEELPWLLSKTASWNKLYEVLCDTDTFLALWKHKPSEVKMYWHKLETKTKKTRTHAYGKLLDRPQLAPLQTILELATFFMETGY
ncbi:MAG: DUF4062 domain-containing protein, partial [Tannerellaceae bacterium]|nr:DUF4062 domain-containing protein [Tannerellaceae bacterium]